MELSHYMENWVRILTVVFWQLDQFELIKGSRDRPGNREAETTPACQITKNHYI